MNHQVTIPQWLALSHEMRNDLISIFHLPKSDGVTVIDGKVQCDGHTHADLARISVEAMQVFLGTEATDFWNLFEEVLARLETKHKKLAAEAEQLVEDVQKKYADARKQAIIETLVNMDKMSEGLRLELEKLSPSVNPVSTDYVDSPSLDEVPPIAEVVAEHKKRGRPSLQK